jgi:hypothetical protein
MFLYKKIPNFGSSIGTISTFYLSTKKLYHMRYNCSMLEQSIVPSGIFGNSEQNIKIFENFIEEKDLVFLQNFCKTINNFEPVEDSCWDNRTLREDSLYKQNRKIFIMLKYKYSIKIKKMIEDYFKFLLLNSPVSIAVWRVEDEQSPHIDKEDKFGNPSWGTHLYDFSSLIYINEDFGGGELYFPNQDIEIKPKSGCLAFFPGDRFYPHGVKKITSGERFTVPIFWTAKEKFT